MAKAWNLKKTKFVLIGYQKILSHKNCGWQRSSNNIFEFIVSYYIRNAMTTIISCFLVGCLCYTHNPLAGSSPHCLLERLWYLLELFTVLVYISVWYTHSILLSWWV
jgi:hypothetical protein